MSRRIGSTNSASISTVSLCSKSYNDPWSISSMTNIGSLFFEMTAPITVKTHGCRNFDNNLISLMKSCLRSECLASTWPQSMALSRSRRLARSAPAGPPMPKVAPLRWAVTRCGVAGMPKAFRCIGDPAGEVPLDRQALPSRPERIDRVDLVVSDGLFSKGGGAGNGVPPTAAGTSTKAPNSEKCFEAPGGMTRLTATAVPRYSALTTKPKVPRPRTSAGPLPKSNSDILTIHIASVSRLVRMM
mmetsp:Transcript_116737/g.337189  ORF Transcript_116737/g.337189 Transcript_116737/m.337189 type:complete len:244 (+) Transcript_116737:1600-2331(+)